MVSVAHAYVDFQLQCNAPTNADHVNFVSSPSIRSTTDILWPCLSILLLCTWNVQHPSVPSHYLKKRPGRLGAVLDALGEWAEAVKWTIIVIIMPEWLFGKAVVRMDITLLTLGTIAHVPFFAL